ncbi:MAG: hypothetical protein ABJL67_15860 [Sulfitobacter sp.]
MTYQKRTECPSFGKRLNPLAAAMVGVMTLTGCSFGDQGFVNVTYTETDKLRTRHVLASGLHFETHGPLAGLSLGRFEAFHVHIKFCDRDAPRLHYQNTVGLQVTASRQEVGLTLGEREILLAGAGSFSGASAVQFTTDHPENTVVTVQQNPRFDCENQI